MSDSYIGVVSLNNEQHLIGSTLFGTCSNTASDTAKMVILPEFDQLLEGVTVHVKFTLGNTASNITLQFNVATATVVSVTGNCICKANDIISFTLDDVSGTKYWRVNSSYVVEEGTTNGTIKVNGEVVSIHGLGSAAYTDTGAYATAAQGTKADNAMPTTGGTFSGAISVPAVSDNSANGTVATVDYVKEKTGGLSGLTGAMHFRGVATSEPSGSTEPTGISDYTGDATMVSGDVVVYESKEYVWTGSEWRLLGDEGSYALKSSTDTITEVASLESVTIGSASGWNAGSQASLTIANNTNTAASLTTDEYSIPYVTQAGTAMTAAVSQGVLTLTPGTNTTLGTNFAVKSVKVFTPNVPANITFTPNTLPQLSVADTGVSRITTHDTTVVVPDNSNNNNNNNS